MDILDKFKEGSYPQRVNRAVRWINEEIGRETKRIARDPRFNDNPAFFKNRLITPLEIIKALLEDLRDALAAAESAKPDVFALDAQMACVKRELALRRNVYKKRVNEGKMTAAQARAEYDAMKAVLETLERLNRPAGRREQL